MKKQVKVAVIDLEKEDLEFMAEYPELFNGEYERIQAGTKVEGFKSWYDRVGYKTFGVSTTEGGNE